MTLTAVEAAARARSITVSHYAVDLDLTGLLHGTTFGSRTTITFSCRQPGPSTTWLDLSARDVRRVRLNDHELDPTAVTGGGDRVQLAGLAAHNQVVVEAVHDAGRGRGLSRSVDAADGAVYAWTHFQPYDARRCFPCFDQPDLKARFSFRLHVPSGWTCVSNGGVREITGAGDTRWWSFAETPPLPTYVTAACAGPFHAVIADGSVRIGLHARRSLAAVLERDAAELIALTRRGLDHFGRHFGRPFPSDSYDYVFLADLPGAMENFGCVTWGDGALYRSTPTRAERDRRASVLLHELSHMWFGDLVTPRWWDGLWLNESFASWAGTWAAAELGGDSRPWAQFLLTHKTRAYAADQAPTTHPVNVRIDDVDAAEAGFDLITYAKGASVLRQLVAWVGEECFLTGLRRYFDRYAWQSCDLAALLAELAAASGRDLRAWSACWLEEAGVPTLAVEAHGPDRSTVVIRQDGTGAPRPHRLRIGVYDVASGGKLSRREVIELDVTGARTPVPDLRGAPPAAVLLPNDDDLTYAKLRVDADSARCLVDAGRVPPTALSRAIAVTAVRDEVLDAERPAADLVRMVIRCLAAEPDAALVAQLLELAIEAATIYTAAEQRPALQAELAAACLDAGRAGAVDRDRAFAFGLARTAVSAAQLDELAALLAKDATDQALRWAALSRLVAAGRAPCDSVEAEAARDPDPDVHLHAVAVRAARPAPDAKGAALDRLLTDETLPITALAGTARELWHPDQEHLLRPHVERYLAALPGLVRDRHSPALRNVVQYTFPAFGVRTEDLAAVRELAGADGVALVARRTLLDKAHHVEGALRARAVPPAI